MLRVLFNVFWFVLGGGVMDLGWWRPDWWPRSRSDGRKAGASLWVQPGSGPSERRSIECNAVIESNSSS
jgi:hypothetical protein